MNRNTQGRLERLQADLEDLRDQHDGFGFGVMSSSVEARISDSLWLHAAKSWKDKRDPVIMRQHNIWTEPDPDGRSCICWWGDEAGVTKFKDWCDKAAGMFCAEAASFPELGEPSGCAELLRQMSAMSEESVPLYEAVRESVALDCARETLPKKLRVEVHRLGSVPKIAVVEIEWAPKFALDVLIHLQHGPKTNWISVDVESDRVVFNGETYPLDPVFVAVLDVLVKANGEPRTQKQMKVVHAILRDEVRLDRRIKRDLPREFPSIEGMIEGGSHGYRLLIPEKLIAH